MLDITLFRADQGGDPDIVRESQRRRYADVTLVDQVIEIDTEWRKSERSRACHVTICACLPAARTVCESHAVCASHTVCGSHAECGSAAAERAHSACAQRAARSTTLRRRSTRRRRTSAAS